MADVAVALAVASVRAAFSETLAVSAESTRRRLDRIPVESARGRSAARPSRSAGEHGGAGGREVSGQPARLLELAAGSWAPLAGKVLRVLVSR